MTFRTIFSFIVSWRELTTISFVWKCLFAIIIAKIENQKFNFPMTPEDGLSVGWFVGLSGNERGDIRKEIVIKFSILSSHYWLFTCFWQLSVLLWYKITLLLSFVIKNIRLGKKELSDPLKSYWRKYQTQGQREVNCRMTIR